MITRFVICPICGYLCSTTLRDGQEVLGQHGDEGLVSVDPTICLGTGMAAQDLPTAPATASKEEAA